MCVILDPHGANGTQNFTAWSNPFMSMNRHGCKPGQERSLQGCQEDLQEAWKLLGVILECLYQFSNEHYCALSNQKDLSVF